MARRTRARLCHTLRGGAKMLMRSYPGSLGEGVPYDVTKAAELRKYAVEGRRLGKLLHTSFELFSYDVPMV